MPGCRRTVLAALAAAILWRPCAAQVQQPAQPPAAGGASVNFSFDQVDIHILAKLVGDITGRRLVVGSDVKGKVTVITPARVPVAEVYPLFVSILESSGFSVVRKEDAYHVVALPAGEVVAAPVVMPGEATPDAGLVTRVFRLANIQAAELARAIEPMVRGGRKGAISALDSTNHMLVTDTAESIRRIEKIVAELDQPGMATSTEIVSLVHASAEDVALQLSTAMAQLESEGQRLARRLPAAGKTEAAAAAPSRAVVVASPHSNSLILVGSAPRLANLREIIAKLDVESPSGHGRLSAIFLRYLSSEQAAKTLAALLAKTEGKDRQRIAIEADPANNALVVDATSRDFEELKSLVGELDRPPQQVLVEVMIAEVSLDSGLDFGVDFLGGASPSEGKTEIVGGMSVGDRNEDLMAGIMQGVIPRGISVGLAKGAYLNAAGQVVPAFPALVNLTADQHKGKLKILSNVPLWAQNNQEATVNIVKNIPLLKSTIEGGAGTARDVIQNIERMDVGIKLVLTPHVNPNGEVMMKLNPTIEAIVSQGGSDNSLTPTIARRQVSTTVTVADGSIIVISGLIRDDEVQRLSKVPILGSIPILGWPFRKVTTAVERTNLLIFVAPHIVTDAGKADAFRAALEQRTELAPNSLTNATPATAAPGPAVPP